MERNKCLVFQHIWSIRCSYYVKENNFLQQQGIALYCRTIVFDVTHGQTPQVMFRSSFMFWPIKNPSGLADMSAMYVTCQGLCFVSSANPLSLLVSRWLAPRCPLQNSNSQKIKRWCVMKKHVVCYLFVCVSRKYSMALGGIQCQDCQIVWHCPSVADTRTARYSSHSMIIAGRSGLSLTNDVTRSSRLFFVDQAIHASAVLIVTG